MKKDLIIDHILNLNPDIVWELDEPDYYALIGHYSPGVDTYWLQETLEEQTVRFLTKLLTNLRKNLPMFK